MFCIFRYGFLSLLLPFFIYVVLCSLPFFLSLGPLLLARISLPLSIVRPYFSPSLLIVLFIFLCIALFPLSLCTSVVSHVSLTSPYFSLLSLLFLFLCLFAWLSIFLFAL